ncbi:MAG: transglutaminase domain-containing protein [Snowella sp.]|nr:transglutaminase domain-containing protein [Snowella sp.]
MSKRKSRARKSSAFWGLPLLCALVAMAMILVSPQAWRSLSKVSNTTALPLIQRVFPPKNLVLTKRVNNPIPGNSENLASNSQLDAIAASLNYSGTSVQEIANQLALHAVTEADKARIIYSWITQHISYDVAMAVSGNIDDLSPPGVLQRRRTICSGYANLYQAIAQAMGLEAIIIEGYARGSSGLVGKDPQVNHAWNGVRIQGVWYLLDTTWGAGSINDQQFKAHFEPYYFATPPRQLIYSHFPKESQWQLFFPAYDRAQFDQLPDVTPRFFQDQLQLLSHPQQAIQANGQLDLFLQAPESTLITAQLKTRSGLAVENNYTFVQRVNSQVTVSVAFPNAGDYTLTIFSKNSEENTYRQAVTHEITANAASEPFPLTYGTFIENNAYLQMPLTQSLPIKQTSFFQLKIDQATKVIVLNQNSNEWTELNKNGNLFTGTVNIDPGKIMVLAQFPNSDKYWTLLEYQ